MRIAAFSDVHGNLPALQAVLAQLSASGPFDHIVGVGDYCLGGIYPAEVMALLTERGYPLLRGNTEEWIVNAATNGAVPPQEVPESMSNRSAHAALDGWAASRLGSDGVAAIQGLPLRWDITGASGQKLTLVHSTPWSTHPVNRQNASDEALTEVLERAEADVVLYAHVHYAHIRQLPGGVVACIGAVGAPYDGDQRACCMVAEDTGDGWTLQHVRVAYDVDAYVAELEQTDMPQKENFAQALRTAQAG